MTSRMYAACLASYNAGVLHGVWIDLDGKSQDEIGEEIASMLAISSPYPNVTVEHAGQQVRSAEEWAAHDWDGAGLSQFGEYPDLDKVVAHVEMLEKHGEAWLAYCDNCSGDADEDGFQESYQGSFDSESDWAASFLEDTGALEPIPENLRNYFDYEAYARDARMGGDVSFVRVDGSLHVFWNH